MIKLSHISIISTVLTLLLSTTINAEGFIKKEVYSFKDKNGNIVFTDKQPNKKLAFKTRIIKAANSTGNIQNNYIDQDRSAQQDYSNNSNSSVQTVRVIVEDGSITKKNAYKKKRTLKRCKSYKKKLAYYSDKLKAGYKNSEYKKLESNRKKYRNLLFNNCETKTFND